MVKSRFLCATAAVLALATSRAEALPQGYSFDTVKFFLGGGIGTDEFATINNKGTVAYQQRIPVGQGQAQIMTRDVFGNVSAGSNPVDGGNNHRFPVINDQGQFATFIQQTVLAGRTNFVVVEPDKSVTLVATEGPLVAGFPDTDFFELDVLRATINNAGQVSAPVTTHANEGQLVRFNADGSQTTIVTTDPFGIVPVSAVGQHSLNDHGDVAFLGQRLGEPGSAFKVFVGDGTAEPVIALNVPNNVFGNLAVINNQGQILVSGTRGIIRSIVGGGPDAFDTLEQFPDLPSSPQPGAINLNNFGQTAYQVGQEVFVDGQRIIGVGDAFGQGTVGAVNLIHQHGFNDSGQVVVAVQEDFTDSQGNPARNAYVLRLDPPGGSPENPLLPFSSTPSGQNQVALNIFNGLGVNQPIFVDPVVATGFVYTQGAGGANFASLIIPDALPGGDADFLLEFVANGLAFSEALTAGQVYDFTALDPLGIDTFRILGIDPAEMVSPADPFVVGLTFVSGGFSSTLSIDAVTADVDGAIPAPAALPLLLSAAALTAAAGRRKR